HVTGVQTCALPIWRAEHHGVELLDHLAGAERAQVTALAAGWTGGVVLGDLGEIGAAFDGSFQLVALSFGGNQDVAGGGSGHGVILRLEKSSSLPQSSAIRNATRPPAPSTSSWRGSAAAGQCPDR